MDIDMAKWSKQAGVSEVELAKAINTLLIAKAALYGIPQKVVLYVKAPPLKKRGKSNRAMKPIP